MTKHEDKISILDEAIDLKELPTVKELLKEFGKKLDSIEHSLQEIEKSHHDYLTRLEEIEKFKTKADKIGRYVFTVLGGLILFFITGFRDWIVEHWEKLINK